jgi:hypothetical protein
MYNLQVINSNILKIANISKSFIIQGMLNMKMIISILKAVQLQYKHNIYDNTTVNYKNYNHIELELSKVRHNNTAQRRNTCHIDKYVENLPKGLSQDSRE